MVCSTPTTTQCVPCISPFEYLIELAYLGTTGNSNTTTFAESLDRILDKGFTLPNCKYCCPDCNGLYVLASVETFLMIAEAIGISNDDPVIAAPLPMSSPLNTLDCCSNVYASTETYLKYAEALGAIGNIIPPAAPFSANVEVPDYDTVLPSCCNGFDECIEELICWISKDMYDSSSVVNIILDKGVVEYGQIQNNCTGAVSTSICKLVDLLKMYFNTSIRNASIKGEFFDRLLDRGLVILCNTNGEIHVFNKDSFFKYAEAVGIVSSNVIALNQTTTTTTTI